MSRAITNALPHHLFWDSHAQASSDTGARVVRPRHSLILLNLPLCGPSMPVRWTFNSHAHCSNGFATCKTGEIIDAQACLAKPPRCKEGKKNCQHRFLVPWSWPCSWPRTGQPGSKGRAITNTQQLARMPPRLPRPHMSRCQYQYRPAPAVAVCCCDRAASCGPRLRRTAVPLGPVLQASCSHADESSTKLSQKASSHPAAGIIKGHALAANSHDPARRFRGEKNLGRKHAHTYATHVRSFERSDKRALKAVSLAGSLFPR